MRIVEEKRITLKTIETDTMDEMEKITEIYLVEGFFPITDIVYNTDEKVFVREFRQSISIK